MGSKFKKENIYLSWELIVFDIYVFVMVLNCIYIDCWKLIEVLYYILYYNIVCVCMYVKLLLQRSTEAGGPKGIYNNIHGWNQWRKIIWLFQSIMITLITLIKFNENIVIISLN